MNTLRVSCDIDECTIVNALIRAEARAAIADMLIPTMLSKASVGTVRVKTTGTTIQDNGSS